ncbi:MAG: type II secretion system protein [Verrucomicrobiota bacterium]
MWQRSNQLFKGFTFTEFLVVMVIVTALAYFTYEPCSLQSARLTRRVNDVRQIALAVEAYANDKGSKFPEKWSQLMPNYIHKDEGQLFLKEINRKPELKSASPGTVDAESIYCLAECQGGMWIVYEQPGSWEEGWVAWGWISSVDGKWVGRETGRGDSDTFRTLLNQIIKTQVIGAHHSD